MYLHERSVPPQPHPGVLPRVAVVGSGVSGLAVAHTLRGLAHTTLYEAGPYFGGHAHTVDVTLPGSGGPVTHGVDTGFLVYNERTYPNLINLFAELGVATVPSDMSFSVQAPLVNGDRLEWSGSDLNTVFAQRHNLARPAFWRMLADVVRFNRLATRLALAGDSPAHWQAMGDFLAVHGFSDAFRDWYFLPMIGSIWSCPTDQMLRFPVVTMLRFCHNHGLIQLTNRPQWYTVQGGSRVYVDKIVVGLADARLNTPVREVRRADNGGVLVVTDGRVEHFDRVVLACHSDQALALLGAHASPQERSVLGAIRYQPNQAVLHTDSTVMPSERKAWAAWNYERAPNAAHEAAQVCLHYWINRLQPLPFEQPVVVSLNPVRDINPRRVLGTYSYAHPVFDLAAVEAQSHIPSLQGKGGVHFCGAWTGYGFHEDGLKSGLQVARDVMVALRDQPAVGAGHP
jgi:uncharacterized protein